MDGGDGGGDDDDGGRISSNLQPPFPSRPGITYPIRAPALTPIYTGVYIYERADLLITREADNIKKRRMRIGPELFHRRVDQIRQPRRHLATTLQTPQKVPDYAWIMRGLYME